MDREYMFHCRGCKKPDKEYPMRFDDYKYGEPVYNTPKVSEHMWARTDAYGIYTGLYCDECYKNNYPYRRDRYYDPAYAGERLEPDE
tara:strand:+ start:255 stop:515 length:261 start_codon:yes stop_codon:yes gene_type:complete